MPTAPFYPCSLADGLLGRITPVGVGDQPGNLQSAPSTTPSLVSGLSGVPVAMAGSGLFSFDAFMKTMAVAGDVDPQKAALLLSAFQDSVAAGQAAVNVASPPIAGLASRPVSTSSTGDEQLNNSCRPIATCVNSGLGLASLSISSLFSPPGTLSVAPSCPSSSAASSLLSSSPSSVSFSTLLPAPGDRRLELARSDAGRLANESNKGGRRSRDEAKTEAMAETTTGQLADHERLDSNVMRREKGPDDRTAGVSSEADARASSPFLYTPKAHSSSSPPASSPSIPSVLSAPASITSHVHNHVKPPNSELPIGHADLTTRSSTSVRSISCSSNKHVGQPGEAAVDLSSSRQPTSAPSANCLRLFHSLAAMPISYVPQSGHGSFAASCPAAGSTTAASSGR
ncbi:unnamed protein product [Protopolystoma xenopodis]|uniref:Uncharacterized protein n=1 Tax=Protopolystoma xenopodis TaxID=117903 RepID=A0A3S5BSX1_9PLAT|nr:unnamed protein product [Protopolystoma xenopodis]